MRDDLGRTAPKKKAVVVLVDLAAPRMRPARDPLRSFVYHAVDRAVRDVFIDGRQAVADGKVLTLDQLDAADRLDRAQHGTIEAAPDRDDRGSTAEAISPLQPAAGGLTPIRPWRDASWRASGRVFDRGPILSP